MRITTLEHLTDQAAPVPADPEAGLGALGTERGNLPLETIDVRSRVTGLAVRTELAQGFRNPYDVPLEATYIFPLPDRAAVTRLRMEADDRIVDGIVKEREQARAEYDHAIATGHRASIAEEERPGVFTMRVGNIMPGERVVIRLTLSGRLPFEDGEATYRFPLVVAPRYIPGALLAGEQVGSGTARDTEAVPDASRISPQVLLPGFPNPVRLTAEVDVAPAGLPVSAIRSSLHGVELGEREDGGFLVRLQAGERADRDFILRLAYGAEEVVATSLAVCHDGGEAANGASPADDRAVAAADKLDNNANANAGAKSDPATPAEGTFLLTLLPPANIAKSLRPRDVVLVLDRSGSMDGWKMAAARRASARIVDALTTADRFAVLAFDTVVETPPNLPAGLVPATDRNRFRAVEHLASVEARGGTELLEPLQDAVALLAGDPSRDRVVVLVTDGQVGNEDWILAKLAPGLTGIRVHTIGIDQAVNAAFLRRLATNGGGRCELVESEDRLDEAMEHIHRRIGSPVVVGLELEGAGLAIVPGSVEPARLPALFAGAPLVVTGRFTGEAAGSIVVTGRTADNIAWTTTVPAVATAEAGLGAFWARGRIRDLEDRYISGGGTVDGATLEQSIVDTSVRFSVLSRFTAFVAIDSAVVNASGAVKQVTQPVDLPAGWAVPGGPGGPGGPAIPKPALPVASMPPMPPMPPMAAPMAPPMPVPSAPSASMPAPGGGYGYAADVYSDLSMDTSSAKSAKVRPYRSTRSRSSAPVPPPAPEPMPRTQAPGSAMDWMDREVAVEMERASAPDSLGAPRQDVQAGSGVHGGSGVQAVQAVQGVVQTWRAKRQGALSPDDLRTIAEVLRTALQESENLPAEEQLAVLRIVLAELEQMLDDLAGSPMHASLAQLVGARDDDLADAAELQRHRKAVDSALTHLTAGAREPRKAFWKR